MYVRRKKLEPFRPSSKRHNMASAEELFPPKTVEKKEVEQNLDAFADGMKDAETGEPIVLSKSGWNVKEGRLNLNTQTILAMGTGRLDIKNRVKLDEAPNTQKLPTRTLYTGGKLSPIYSGEHTPQSYRLSDPALHSKLVHMRAGNILNDDSHNDASGFNSPVTSALSSTNISRRNSYQPDTNLNAALLARALQSIPQTPHTALTEEIPTGHRRHPLLTQYLKEGPLNAMYHRYWDPRSNTVVAEDEHGQPLEVAEEGVDDSGDEADEGDREEHTALATHLSTLNSTVGRSTSLRGGDDGSSVTSSSSMTVSLASRLTGSTRHRHKRASDKGSWSHRSRKDSETASSRLAGSAASQAAVDLTIGVVDPAIVLSNKRNWQATEERLFQELFALGWQYEHNKSLTKEQGGRGGLAEVRQTARAMARLKVKGMQELVQAYADEKIRDEKRMQLESENTHPNKVRYLAELMKVHEEERRKSRRYLHALEQDNEIMLIRKLSETGWLW